MDQSRRIDDKRDESSSLRDRKTIVDYLLVLLFIILVFVTFAPMINIFARSFSGANAISLGQVFLWPVDWQTDAYRLVLMDSAYTTSLWFTTYLTVTAVVVSLTLVILTAFPLTYDNLKGRRVFTFMMIFTMFFGVGMVPNFILMRDLNLLNTFWVLVIPNAIGVVNVILMRAFFFGIPASLKESAEVEGANPFQILVKIYLPLSAPVLATISLFIAIGRWNGFADALIYIMPSHRHLFPIQLLLNQLINAATNIETAAMEGLGGLDFGGLTESLRAATIMIATVPILLIYPWLQRYFIAGVTLGAVKE